MNAIVASVAGTVGAVLLRMIMGLISERFIRQAVIMALEKLVKMSATEEDDKLLQLAKESWAAPVEPPKPAA